MLSGMFDVVSYGAIGNGVADDTAAVQAAIDAAEAAKGGVVFFPAGKCFKIAGTLNADQTYNVILRGAVGPEGIHFESDAANLLFTQSGDAACISARSSYGFRLEGLRIFYSHASYTGYVVDFDGTLAADSAYALIDNCVIRGTSGSAINATGVNLYNSICMTIRGTQFSRLDTAIIGKSLAGYSNVIQIEKCQFLLMVNPPLKNAGEMWTVQDCTFQQLLDQTSGAYTETVTAFGPVFFFGCWFGDVTQDGGNWIKYTGNSLVCIANRFAPAGDTSACILLGGASAVSQVTLIGNDFQANLAVETVAGGGINYLTAIGNSVSGTFLDESANVIGTRLVFNTGSINDDTELAWSDFKLQRSRASTLDLDGDLDWTASSKGPVIRSPNNARWRLVVSNAGVVTATAL